MATFYLSKNYNNTTSAGNKAKTDIEQVLSGLGYKNAGLAQTVYPNKIIGFMRTLASVLRVFFTISAKDTVIIQYPFKKYYSFVCHIIHFRKGKVITVIHDLGAFRRKKLTIDKEIRRLNHTDVLIVHNENMKDWLQQQGYTKPMICLGIWDYLSFSENNNPHLFDGKCIKVIYAGSLSYRKNEYLYHLDGLLSKWQFELYGGGFEEGKINNKKHFNYHGFIPSEQLIEQVDAHFGLIWDGESTSACSGNFGDYLKLNNPHKTSLYIRCNLPLIIWEKAALATFVSENHIGICIRSLEELDTILPALSAEMYNEMKENVKKINKKISSGYYINKALSDAKNYL